MAVDNRTCVGTGWGLAKSAARTTEASPRPLEWTWYASAPLRGCGLIRERQWVYVWDDANTIYLLTIQGELIATRRSPRDLVHVAAADVTGNVVTLSRSGEATWLGTDLEVQTEVRLPFDPLSVAVDPHGHRAVISGHGGRHLIADRVGTSFTEFQTKGPLKHLAFVPTDGTIVGASENGLLGLYTIEGEAIWQVMVAGTIGHLAIDGDGETILLAALNHGLMRYDSNGTREGTYRLEQTPRLVATDFDGQRIVTATAERTLIELHYDGQIKTNVFLPDLPVALALDGIGRFAVIGYTNGQLQVSRLDGLFRRAEGETISGLPVAATSPELSVAPGGGLHSEPLWEKKIGADVEEARTTVVAFVPGDEVAVAAFTSRKTVRVFDQDGEEIAESPAMRGLGRILETDGGSLLAATSDAIAQYHADRRTFHVIEDTYHDISHFEPTDKAGRVLVVEGCQTASMLDVSAKPLWKKELDYRVHAAAGAADGSAAFALDDFNLFVYDATGKRIGKYRSKTPESMEVLPLSEGWATLARDARVVRGHDRGGELLWSTPVPWTPWNFRKVGRFLVVTAADGRSLLLDEDGTLRAESAEPRENARYFLMRDGEVARIYVVADTIIITGFDGRLRWRRQDEHVIGPYAVGPLGLAVCLGRLLTFFPFSR